MTPAKTAEEQFHTSSQYPVPLNWRGPTFEIRNDYPTPAPIHPGHHHGHHPTPASIHPDYPALPLPNIPDYPALPLPNIPGAEAPWLHIDFHAHPLKYANMIKEYCWEGNRSVDFVVQENTQRAWYHAPWMHYSDYGREPLKGLTFERSIPPGEFAENQTDALQNWAIGFYNSPGASVFGGVWANPSNPVWDKDLEFPQGTCVFKLLLTTATDEQVFTMKGSPHWDAVISPQPDPKTAPSSGKVRNKFSSKLRLIQVDFAVVDKRSPIGWVFGTFMYNGTLPDTDPWDRLTCVGLQWGNDPKLDQAAFDAGQRPEESWINPEAEKLRKALNGKRPSWGYNGRLCGPADNFVSACASCHSVAQSYSAPMVQSGQLIANKWVPLNEKLTMTWFENVPAGKPFSTRGALSADYSLQFVAGWQNYQSWFSTQPKPGHKHAIHGGRILFGVPGPVGRRVVFKPSNGGEVSEEVEEALKHVSYESEPARAGPELIWE
ncbi:hypothetical protein B0H19DRAFT_700414 [Mycena capillaripes]|nr:hypothetical protein B0H19DRAFT_700414 [Mycena capillaripes]